MTIKTLSEFMNAFPDAEWLESFQGKSRYTNGLGEGSDYESEWFCDRCESILNDCMDECDECDRTYNRIS